jgi:hypothetical protein
MKFEIKSFKGGKSDYEDRGIFGSFKRGKNLDVRGLNDVLTCNQALVADGTGASGADTIVTDLINFWVNASDGNTYGFGDSGKIYKRTSSAVWSVVYTDSDGEITGAYEWFSPTTSYLYWTTSTKLHRHIITGNWTTDVDATTASVASSGTLTVSDQPHSGSTVTIGEITYTFRTTLTTSPTTIANEVLIGANAEAAIDNLVKAITLAATIGTNYSTGTLVHPTCTAVKATAATMTVTAKTVGDAGNSIITIPAGDHLAFAQPTLKNGVTYSAWPKINLTAATWHTMTQANGSLMICNNKFLAMVGYDSSYTNEALKLRPGITTQAIIEKGNQVLIGGGDGVRESWLSTWEQTALSWIDKNRIPSKSINAIVQAELMLMSCGDNELFFSDMVNNMPVCTLDGKCNPGGVVEKGGLALFGLYGGSYPGIWSYGRQKKNESHTLNLEQYIDADEIGSICKIAGQVFVSYQHGTDHLVRKVDTATKATAEYESLDLVAPQEATWTSIELTTGTIPTGCTIAVYYDLDATGSWIQAKMAGDVSTAIAGMRDPIFLCGSYGRTFNLKIVLTPSSNTSPEVSKVVINLQ